MEDKGDEFSEEGNSQIAEARRRLNEKDVEKIPAKTGLTMRSGKVLANSIRRKKITGTTRTSTKTNQMDQLAAQIEKANEMTERLQKDNYSLRLTIQDQMSEGVAEKTGTIKKITPTKTTDRSMEDGAWSLPQGSSPIIPEMMNVRRQGSHFKMYRPNEGQNENQFENPDGNHEVN